MALDALPHHPVNIFLRLNIPLPCGRMPDLPPQIPELDLIPKSILSQQALPQVSDTVEQIALKPADDGRCKLLLVVTEIECGDVPEDITRVLWRIYRALLSAPGCRI